MVKHVAHADKKYKNMTAKQKLRIANKTYDAYRMYYVLPGAWFHAG